MRKHHAISLFTLVAGLAMSHSAAKAQCTWFVDDVPDLDQQRLGDLPANGGMYCAPTSTCNWFAYLANHGVTQPLTFNGPHDWESQSNYNHVTDLITFMGTLMQTDPQRGTRGTQASGAQAYVTFAAPGDFIISSNWVWSTGDTISPTYMTNLHNLGAYFTVAYGRYGSSTGGTRGGGHVLSGTGIWDLGCGQAPILQFSDPNDDRPANSTQSDFRTSMAALTAVTGQFRPSSDDNFQTKTLYRMDKSDLTDNFIDSVMCILPTSALFSELTDLGQLSLVTPFRPTGSPIPLTHTFGTAAGTGAVIDVAAGPQPLAHYYLAARTGSQGAGAWKLNLVTGVSTRMTTNLDPKRIALGRLGDLYVLDSDGVNRYDMATTPPTLVSTFTPTLDVEALAYDDKSDTVLMLTKEPTLGSRRVLSFPRTLSGFGTDRALPVNLNGEVYIAPDAETAGAFFVCADGSPTLSRIEYSSAATALVVTDSITHINGALTALNVTDDNRLVYAVNGVLVEREENAQGQWVPRVGSRWAGRAAAGKVSMVRSRHNFIASLIDKPSFDNLIDPTIYPSLPTCYANCDNSTSNPVLTANDFQCFLNSFASGKPYGNCDHSSTNPILNANDFQCFLNAFAAGCT